MNRRDNYLITALAFSAILMLVNIIAVTNGMADGYYTVITDWLNSI